MKNGATPRRAKTILLFDGTGRHDNNVVAVVH